jgi:hypothetical protein
MLFEKSRRSFATPGHRRHDALDRIRPLEFVAAEFEPRLGQISQDRATVARKSSESFSYREWQAKVMWPFLWYGSALVPFRS